jgi:hypothetical protein
LLYSVVFLPLFDWHSFEMNGLNYILSTHIPTYKYFLLVIPFSTVALFFGALEDEKYLLNRNLLSTLPFLASALVLVKYFTTGSRSEGNFFAEIDLGFWMMLGFSMLLMLMRAKRKFFRGINLGSNITVEHQGQTWLNRRLQFIFCR